MARKTAAGLVALATVAALASAGTEFISTWKAPDSGPLHLRGKKVLALVLGADPAVRPGAEDMLARELTSYGAVGLPAYSVVPAELTQDKAKARELIEQAGIAGVVSMRVTSKDDQFNSTPSSIYYGAPHYATFWSDGYYGYTSAAIFNPGYVRTDTIVTVETLVYSLAQDKLVWAGRSTTKNPRQVGKFVQDLTAKVASELKKVGLIGKP
jgi:hypothetical protein